MHVEPREGERFDQFLRRFKTSMDKSGILREYKRKLYLKSNGELQREKAKAAARRRTKRFRGPRPLRPARGPIAKRALQRSPRGAGPAETNWSAPPPATPVRRGCPARSSRQPSVCAKPISASR